MIYALKDKKYFQFICVSKTKKEFEEKIEKAYWDWLGCKSKTAYEETKSKEVYLTDYIKVKLTINRL